MTTSPMVARKAKLKTHLVSAKAKLKLHVTPRRVVLLAAAAFSVFLILSTIRTLNHSAPRRAATPAAAVAGANQQDQGKDCVGKAAVPTPVAAALIHYATSGETPPRLTEAEAGAAARVILSRRAPCNLLVLGLGPAAPLWLALNHGGRTLFLDPDGADHIAAARAAHPAGAGELHAHPITYQQEHSATITDELLALRNSSNCATSSPAALSPELVERPACPLAPRGLPAAFYEAEEWDVIVVEAPVVPGAIYTAAVSARVRRRTGTTTDVLVHGVDGAAEERFVRAFLCEGYIKEEAGRLRHFAIPSHMDEKEAMPFCP